MRTLLLESTRPPRGLDGLRPGVRGVLKAEEEASAEGSGPLAGP